MKLNYDCIRSVLLELEKNLDIDEDLRRVYVPIENLFQQLPKYEPKDILYTVEKLSEAGYIKASIQYAGRMFNDGQVESITYQGHEFLESVRNNKLWENVKSILSKLGTASPPVICEAAKRVISSTLQGLI